MFCLHILLKKAALRLDDGLHPASEGQQTLATMALSMEAKFSLMEVIREALLVWTHREASSPSTPACSSGPWATWHTCRRHGRGQVLRPHPRTISCHCLDPEEGRCSPWPPNRCPCWPRGQSPRCEGAFLTFLEAIGALGAWETTCLGSLVSVRAPS